MSTDTRTCDGCGAALPTTAERMQEAERLRRDRARDALLDAIRANVDKWDAALVAAWARADRAAVGALAKFEAAERERRQVRSTIAWIAHLDSEGVTETAVRKSPRKLSPPAATVCEMR